MADKCSNMPTTLYIREAIIKKKIILRKTFSNGGVGVSLFSYSYSEMVPNGPKWPKWSKNVPNVPIVSQGSNPLNKTDIPRKNLPLKMGGKKSKGFHKYKKGGGGHHFEKIFLKIPFFLNDGFP